MSVARALIDHAYEPSEVNFGRAARGMAELYVFAKQDPTKTPAELVQIEGSFVLACMFSGGEADLSERMLVDLTDAGGMPESEAKQAVGRLTTRTFLETVTSGTFIQEDLPTYGLRRKGKGGHVRFAVDEPVFLRKVLRMSKR